MPPSPSSPMAAASLFGHHHAGGLGCSKKCGDSPRDLAGKLYGAKVLFESIEDQPNNITRFFVLSRQRALASGDDKTSLMFTTAHEPGALVQVLGAFAYGGINLTHIDKRPSRRENWNYTFFVDMQGHRDDPGMQRAIEAARGHCQELRVLGSYPRATRTL